MPGIFDRQNCQIGNDVGGSTESTHEAERRDIEKVLLPIPMAKLSAPKLRAMSASIPNFSRVLSIRSRGSDGAGLPSRMSQLTENVEEEPRRTPDVRRWDPLEHTSTPWDGLRRDNELWFPSGDCAVHLYSKGRSRRRPSFMISSSILDAADCTHMIRTYRAPDHDQSHAMRSSSSSSLDSLSGSATSVSGSFDLFLAAPEDALRSNAFRWHLATRNFFAWLHNKPLVGSDLGDAFIDLLDRMNFLRPHSDNTCDILSYARQVGYLDFNNRPEYALALLRLAEQFRLRDLWIETFAHCVGMNERLSSTAGFDATSRVTKALITRAYLEMDLHLGRVSRALRTFLEDELCPANFGLPTGAQAHLDRFRSVLHSFYVNKLGYWPPEKGTIFSKPLLESMASEFDKLYKFLVDGESSESMQDQTKPANGGICVIQNLNAFNERHNYDPLSHPLPLVPEYQSQGGKTESQRGLRAFKLGGKPTRVERGTSARKALAMATNSSDPTILDCPLVREYIRFEQQWSSKPEEKVSVADARRVRWIVIYSILQMLTSVTRAPAEVNDPGSVPYHMCLLTTGTPPWGTTTKGTPFSAASTRPGPVTANSSNSLISFIADSGAISLGIQPDCDVTDFVPKRTLSNASLRPAPLRINTSFLSRRNSLKDFSKHVIPSRRSSINRVSLPLYSARRNTVSITETGFSSAQRSGNDYTFVKDESRTTSQDLFGPPSDSSFGIDSVVEGTAPTLDAFMLDGHSDTESRSSAPSLTTSNLSSPVSSGSWQFDDTDSFSFTSGDERRSSKGLYSMEHESVYSSSAYNSPSTAKHSRSASEFSTPQTPLTPAGSHERLQWYSAKSGKVDYNDDEDASAVFETQVDIERALDLLPLHIPAQGAMSSWMN